VTDYPQERSVIIWTQINLMAARIGHLAQGSPLGRPRCKTSPITSQARGAPQIGSRTALAALSRRSFSAFFLLQFESRLVRSYPSSKKKSAYNDHFLGIPSSSTRLCTYKEAYNSASRRCNFGTITTESNATTAESVWSSSG
jgi:hypothetical protein